MYFTDTPTLNSIEAIMQQTPGNSHRGGGRRRSPYQYTKADCDCRLCLHYNKMSGCTADACPVMDIRIECGAATLADAVMEAFKDCSYPALRKRITQIYNRKDTTMLFQNNRHRLHFEEQLLHLRKPSKKAEAVLYLLTADKTLWQSTRHHISEHGKVDIKNVHLGDISPDGYALWKAAKELQTGERQISLSELSDREAVSDHAFQYIVQAVTIARFGAAALKETEVNRHV